MVVFSKKLSSFSGEAAQHGRPLQTPLVSLINHVFLTYSLQRVAYFAKMKYLMCNYSQAQYNNGSEQNGSGARQTSTIPQGRSG